MRHHLFSHSPVLLLVVIMLAFLVLAKLVGKGDKS